MNETACSALQSHCEQYYQTKWFCANIKAFFPQASWIFMRARKALFL
jgi:hypothetical protein